MNLVPSMNYLRQLKLSRRVCYGRKPHQSEFPPPSSRLTQEDQLEASLLAQHCQPTHSLKDQVLRAAASVSATLLKQSSHAKPRAPVDPLGQDNSLHTKHDPLNYGTRSSHVPQCLRQHQSALVQQRRIDSAPEVVVRTKVPLALAPSGKAAHTDPLAGKTLDQHEVFTSRSLPPHRLALAHGLLAHLDLCPARLRRKIQCTAARRIGHMTLA